MMDGIEGVTWGWSRNKKREITQVWITADTLPELWEESERVMRDHVRGKYHAYWFPQSPQFNGDTGIWWIIWRLEGPGTPTKQYHRPGH